MSTSANLLKTVALPLKSTHFIYDLSFSESFASSSVEILDIWFKNSFPVVSELIILSIELVSVNLFMILKFFNIPKIKIIII